MTENSISTTTQTTSNNAAAHKFLGDLYSICGLHTLAAETYRKAAALFREAGNLEEGQNCSCAWLLSEIAA